MSRLILLILLLIAYVGQRHISAQNIETLYILDSVNRLTEVHYPDKIIRYTYDDAGNRTGMTIEVLAAAPSITNITPDTATVSGNAFLINITGNNFTGNSVVQWNGTTRSTTFIDVNNLTASISPGDLDSIGTIAVSVLNQDTNSVSNTVFFTVNSGGSCIPVSIDNNLTAPSGSIISIPVSVSDLTARGVDAFDLILNFDSNVIRPVSASPVTTAGTLSSGLNISANTAVPGWIQVGGFGASQLTGSGTLLKLNFEVIGAQGTNSALTWTDFQFNSGDPCKSASNGFISVSSASYSISGGITYGTTPVNQSAKFVPGVSLNAAGSSILSSISDSSGNYLLSGLMNGGNYTITPSKSGGANGITSFDAAQILRFIAAGGGTLNQNQQAAADTNGSNTISSFDATQILRFVAAGGTTTAQTGQITNWKFLPSSHSYSSLSSSLANENFEAILVGEVNGSWQPPAAFNLSEEENEKQTESPQILPNNQEITIPLAESSAVKDDSVLLAGISISLPSNSTASTGSIITIPVTLGDNDSKIISGYSFAVNFDPDILQPESPAFDKNGTLSSNFSVISDANTAGRLGIAAAGGNETITGTGTLLNLRFRVIGTAGSTNLIFNQVLFEDDNGEPIPTTPTNGSFTVLGATAASVAISGRVSAADGRGIMRARLTLINTAGEIRTILTNPFGYFRFTDVAAGETYTISVSSKQHSFTPDSRILTIKENILDLNFVSDN